MFIVYSKNTGEIKTLASGDAYKSLEDLFPNDYLDYQIIYDFINIEDDETVLNNPNLFIIRDNKLKLKMNLDKYIEKEGSNC